MTAAATAVDLTDRVRRVAAVAREHARRTDDEAVFPTEALAELRASGLLALVVPAAYGGLGGGPAELVDCAESLARADLSVALIFAMHCQQVATVARYGGDELRATLLPRVAAGERYLASVTTSAGTGGHLLSATAPLRDTEEGLLIERFAPIVTGGAHADGFLITMGSPGADASGQAGQVCLVYAEREQLRITESGRWQPMGMRASHSVALQLTGTVPRHQMIGPEHGFREISLALFSPLAHLGWAACWLGSAAGALSRVATLLRSPEGRRRFDHRSELLLTRLARARHRIDAVHALLRHTQHVVEEGGELSTAPVQMLLNGLKVTAAESCRQAVEELVDAVGLRHGYFKDSDTYLERVLRDLRSASLNYHNDRLDLADGRHVLLDRKVTHVGG
ncbi:acyl-CoA/acyl-ACP dehydrogenase [Micromonospora sp. WMMD1120]|uniref:acyl-CoA dehydrogenase family protein n=1 Tax=Micromonospora sp. WMMD1120 TaxID=3016106 RepID=UPI0024179065|nr:acyl-CoA dehydrogenase family protein [Micromonospora sp. WMMD1120]MDG4809359.1 acyl-CoA/acyl-ACP dehydrogenase [Micromonospora sp. WMMD1120]